MFRTPLPLRPGRRAAFTLVELLVVIAIIGVLVALLLPAIQAAREAARRGQCQSQLKQIGLAILNYESARKKFPPGSTTTGNGITSPLSSTWTVSILPNMELQALYSIWDPKVDFSVDTTPGGVRNKKLRETYVPTYLCPSDQEINMLVQPDSGQGMGMNWAPGSYRGVSGVRYIRNVAIDQGGSAFWDNPESNAAAMDADGQLPRITRGPLHAVLNPTSTATTLRKLPPVSLKEISDGTSSTLLVGEYHTLSPTPNLSRRTMWAYGYTSYNQSSMINDANTLIPDFNRCASAPGVDVNECKRSWGSFHTGDIIQFVRCDGSITDVSPSIDLEVFCAMGTIQAEDPR